MGALYACLLGKEELVEIGRSRITDRGGDLLLEGFCCQDCCLFVCPQLYSMVKQGVVVEASSECGCAGGTGGWQLLEMVIKS